MFSCAFTEKLRSLLQMIAVLPAVVPESGLSWTQVGTVKTFQVHLFITMAEYNKQSHYISEEGREKHSRVR